MNSLNTLYVLLFLFCTSPISAQTLEIYVSDAGNFNNPPWQILKFDANGENPEVFIDDHLAWPQDIVFLENDNTVLISNLNTGVIARFNASTGDYIDDFATGIGGPTRMKIGEDDLLYVLQWSGNGRVLRYQLDGTFVDEFTTVGLGTSIGLDWDSDGNLYVSSYGQNIIRKYGADGSDLGVFIDSNVQGPTNIWFGADGDLFVLNWNGSTISRFDSDGNFLGSFISGLGQSEGVDFLENGNILIGNGQDATVKMFDSDGNFMENLVPAGSANLLQPNAVILREVITSTTVPTEQEPFIYPSHGEIFYLDSTLNNSFTQFLVYNASGGLVARIQPASDDVLWDAGNCSSGTYFILGMTTEGNSLSQRIIVQR